MSKEEQLDFVILRDGGISMYHRNNFLDEDINELENLGYRIVDFDTAKWTIQSCHKYLKLGLTFPDYYGENLDALSDCMEDLLSTKRKGLVIVFRNFDAFVQKEREYFEGILDVLANQSRFWLLHQKKLIILIQSDDADLSFGKIGGVQASWNGNEWFDVDRRS